MKIGVPTDPRCVNFTLEVESQDDDSQVVILLTSGDEDEGEETDTIFLTLGETRRLGEALIRLADACEQTP